MTDQKVLATAASAKAIKGSLGSGERMAEQDWDLPVGKHTYIAAYGGVNRAAEPGVASGPLSTGYGARPTAFGPEYAFGIMLEKNLDQPVLIIKTAWGGKSLHYDFRPPSAGPYQPTANEKAQVEKWKAKKAAWDKYIAGGGTPAAMVQMEKDIKALENQKRNLQAVDRQTAQGPAGGGAGENCGHECEEQGTPRQTRPASRRNARPRCGRLLLE